MALITHETLLKALKASIKPTGGPSNGGLDNHMWAAVTDRSGIVKAVCYSGNDVGDQWPGSRAIAISKANTANGLSLPTFAFSTANLYSGAQPGGFLYGILETNPVDTASMFGGEGTAYGTPQDPMVGKKASGVVVFGGGLALYDGTTIVGALGAKRLLFLTDVDGVLDANKKLIPELTMRDAKALIADGTISGGMIPKVETCLEALDNGVEGVVILNGKTPHSVLLELFTEHGAGTLIVP